MCVFFIIINSCTYNYELNGLILIGLVPSLTITIITTIYSVCFYLEKKINTSYSLAHTRT